MIKGTRDRMTDKGNAEAIQLWTQMTLLNKFSHSYPFDSESPLKHGYYQCHIPSKIQELLHLSMIQTLPLQHIAIIYNSLTDNIIKKDIPSTLSTTVDSIISNKLCQNNDDIIHDIINQFKNEFDDVINELYILLFHICYEECCQQFTQEYLSLNIQPFLKPGHTCHQLERILRDANHFKHFLTQMDTILLSVSSFNTTLENNTPLVTLFQVILTIIRKRQKYFIEMDTVKQGILHIASIDYYLCMCCQLLCGLCRIYNPSKIIVDCLIKDLQSSINASDLLNETNTFLTESIHLGLMSIILTAISSSELYESIEVLSHWISSDENRAMINKGLYVLQHDTYEDINTNCQLSYVINSSVYFYHMTWICNWLLEQTHIPTYLKKDIYQLLLYQSFKKKSNNKDKCLSTTTYSYAYQLLDTLDLWLIKDPIHSFFMFEFHLNSSILLNVLKCLHHVIFDGVINQPVEETFTSSFFMICHMLFRLIRNYLLNRPNDSVISKQIGFLQQLKQCIGDIIVSFSRLELFTQWITHDGLHCHAVYNLIQLGISEFNQLSIQQNDVIDQHFIHVMESSGHKNLFSLSCLNLMKFYNIPNNCIIQCIHGGVFYLFKLLLTPIHHCTIQQTQLIGLKSSVSFESNVTDDYYYLIPLYQVIDSICSFIIHLEKQEDIETGKPSILFHTGSSCNWDQLGQKDIIERLSYHCLMDDNTVDISQRLFLKHLRYQTGKIVTCLAKWNYCEQLTQWIQFNQTSYFTHTLIKEWLCSACNESVSWGLDIIASILRSCHPEHIIHWLEDSQQYHCDYNGQLTLHFTIGIPHDTKKHQTNNSTMTLHGMLDAILIHCYNPVTFLSCRSLLICVSVLVLFVVAEIQHQSMESTQIQFILKSKNKIIQILNGSKRSLPDFSHVMSQLRIMQIETIQSPDASTVFAKTQSFSRGAYVIYQQLLLQFFSLIKRLDLNDDLQTTHSNDINEFTLPTLSLQHTYTFMTVFSDETLRYSIISIFSHYLIHQLHQRSNSDSNTIMYKDMSTETLYLNLLWITQQIELSLKSSSQSNGYDTQLENQCYCVPKTKQSFLQVIIELFHAINIDVHSIMLMKTNYTLIHIFKQTSLLYIKVVSKLYSIMYWCLIHPLSSTYALELGCLSDIVLCHHLMKNLIISIKDRIPIEDTAFHSLYENDLINHHSTTLLLIVLTERYLVKVGLNHHNFNNNHGSISKQLLNHFLLKQTVQYDSTLSFLVDLSDESSQLSWRSILTKADILRTYHLSSTQDHCMSFDQSNTLCQDHSYGSTNNLLESSNTFFYILEDQLLLLRKTIRSLLVYHTWTRQLIVEIETHIQLFDYTTESVPSIAIHSLRHCLMASIQTSKDSTIQLQEINDKLLNPSNTEFVNKKNTSCFVLTQVFLSISVEMSDLGAKLKWLLDQNKEVFIDEINSIQQQLESLIMITTCCLQIWKHTVHLPLQILADPHALHLPKMIFHSFFTILNMMTHHIRKEHASINSVVSWSTALILEAIQCVTLSLQIHLGSCFSIQKFPWLFSTNHIDLNTRYTLDNTLSERQHSVRHPVTSQRAASLALTVGQYHQRVHAEDAMSFMPIHPSNDTTPDMMSSVCQEQQHRIRMVPLSFANWDIEIIWRLLFIGHVSIGMKIIGDNSNEFQFKKNGECLINTLWSLFPDILINYIVTDQPDTCEEQAQLGKLIQLYSHCLNKHHLTESNMFTTHFITLPDVFYPLNDHIIFSLIQPTEFLDWIKQHLLIDSATSYCYTLLFSNDDEKSHRAAICRHLRTALQSPSNKDVSNIVHQTISQQSLFSINHFDVFHNPNSSTSVGLHTLLGLIITTILLPFHILSNHIAELLSLEMYQDIITLITKETCRFSYICTMIKAYENILGFLTFDQMILSFNNCLLTLTEFIHMLAQILLSTVYMFSIVHLIQFNRHDNKQINCRISFLICVKAMANLFCCILWRVSTSLSDMSNEVITAAICVSYFPLSTFIKMGLLHEPNDATIMDQQKNNIKDTLMISQDTQQLLCLLGSGIASFPQIGYIRNLISIENIDVVHGLYLISDVIVNIKMEHVPTSNLIQNSKNNSIRNTLQNNMILDGCHNNIYKCPNCDQKILTDTKITKDRIVPAINQVKSSVIQDCKKCLCSKNSKTSISSLTDQDSYDTLSSIESKTDSTSNLPNELLQSSNCDVRNITIESNTQHLDPRKNHLNKIGQAPIPNQTTDPVVSINQNNILLKDTLSENSSQPSLDLDGCNCITNLEKKDTSSVSIAIQTNHSIHSRDECKEIDLENDQEIDQEIDFTNDFSELKDAIDLIDNEYLLSHATDTDLQSYLEALTLAEASIDRQLAEF